MTNHAKKGRPDLEPGFWCNYEPPKRPVADAIQYPLDDTWSGRVINAYHAEEKTFRK